MKSNRTTVFVAFLFIIIFYLLFDNHLHALIASLVVAAVTFGWRARVLIAVAMVFLLAIPLLLLAQETHWAEQMVTYAYGTFGVVVLIEFFLYLKDAARKLEDQAQGSKKIPGFFWLFSLVTLLLCITMIVGFIYLYRSFQNATASYTVGEEADARNYDEWRDKELEDVKKQLQEAVDFVSQNAYNSRTRENTDILPVSEEIIENVDEEESGEDVRASLQLIVLNGTTVVGAAARQRDELIDRGYTVISIGNADTYDYTDTVIRHAEGQEKEAELIMQDLGTKFSITTEPDATLETGTISIIIGAIRTDQE